VNRYIRLALVLGTQYAAASPLPQATSVSSAITSAMSSGTSSATPAAGATIVSGFVPSPGGPPAETLYVVTAYEQTYLAGYATATATGSDGTPTAIVHKDVFVLTNGTIDYYAFNGTDFILQATECDVIDNGTIANCNGTAIDIMDGGTALQVVDGQNFSGMSSGVTAYQPTGTADPEGLSLASAAPSLVASATSFLSSYVSSVQQQASAEVASATAEASSEVAAATQSLDVDGGGFTFTGGDYYTAA